MHTLLTERLTLVRVTIRCKVCVKGTYSKYFSRKNYFISTAHWANFFTSWIFSRRKN